MYYYCIVASNYAKHPKNTRLVTDDGKLISDNPSYYRVVSTHKAFPFNIVREDPYIVVDVPSPDMLDEIALEVDAEPLTPEQIEISEKAEIEDFVPVEDDTEEDTPSKEIQEDEVAPKEEAPPVVPVPLDEHLPEKSIEEPKVETPPVEEPTENSAETQTKERTLKTDEKLSRE